MFKGRCFNKHIFDDNKLKINSTSSINLLTELSFIKQTMTDKKKGSSSDGPPSKKSRKEVDLNTSVGDESTSATNNLHATIAGDRLKTAKSINDFKFNKKRVKVLSTAKEVMDDSNGIVYWMSRDARVQDNWAMLFAQKLALKCEIPLHVCFCLVPKFLDATVRHFKFLLKGLEEVQEECTDLDISFHLLYGPAHTVLPDFVRENKIGAVVCEFSPLRVPAAWTKGVVQKLPEEVSMCQVDAHNIVPCWIASDKQEYAARTIRNKINSKLDEFLTPFPPLIKHPYRSNVKCEVIDLAKALAQCEVDRTVDAVSWAVPGYTAGIDMLQVFCNKRLKIFNTKRNDPLADALSKLSPWFHFGQISVQRCILTVQKYKSKYPESVNAFCEEAIVRRELADNFCHYNDKYDSLEGGSSWARESLQAHKKDKRTYIYTRDELDKSRTHDDLWNSAQIQLVKEGKMHGFLRMYWAKKILEWTQSPEEALQIAIYLNDRYSLDGRDPNGYVGCMWSIVGIHDMGWKEREIFGKIRYMNYNGCKRKFDLKGFVARWGGKVYPYKTKV